MTPIKFDTKDYQFEKEITATLEQNKDISFSATRFSFVSAHEKLLKSLERNSELQEPLSDSVWNAINLEFTPINADDHILAEAESHDIIIFNENHYLPRHRNFVSSLLSELYEQGYRFLALEAIGMLGNGNMFDVKMAARGYPMRYTGFYTKEPEFSMLIRRAIDLGFHIIGYDEGSSFGYSGGEREARGAENIIRQLSESGVEGKLVVLCGWDHLREGESGTYWEYALAERLHQKTGKDPLTVNQTVYNERLTKEYEEPLMQMLDNSESIVLVNKQGESIDLTENTTWYDMFVFHSRTKFNYGIPDWVLKDGPTRIVDHTKVGITYPLKVFVFQKDDDVAIAAPIYVTEVNSQNDELTVPSRGLQIKVVVSNGTESYLIEFE